MSGEHAGDTPPSWWTRAWTGVRWSIVVAGIGIAVHLLLPQVGSLEEATKALRSGSWWWLGSAAITTGLDALANGAPATTPSLKDMRAAWLAMTGLADQFLEPLTTEDLVVPLRADGRSNAPAAGSQLQRITYHYWNHIGEASAVRQLLGHERLAQFVGNIESRAPYRPEG